MKALHRMRPSLLDIVRREALLDEARLDAAARGGGSADALVRAGLDDAVLAAALARGLGLPLVELSGEEIETDALRLLPLDLAQRHRALPLGLDVPVEGRRLLRVAMADPTDGAALAALESATDCTLAPVLARLGALEEATARAYRAITTVVMKQEHARTPFGGSLTVATPARARVRTEPFHSLEDEAPVELRHRALLDLLCQKGMITQEEYLAELRRLLKERA
jgi:hypothetical protein